jgi:hypothetical protein
VVGFHGCLFRSGYERSGENPNHCIVTCLPRISFVTVLIGFSSEYKQMTLSASGKSKSSTISVLLLGWITC